MDTYSVETDPEQVVRWLMVERQIGSPGLVINAQRVNEMQAVERNSEAPLDEQDHEDLSDTTTIATLEVAPIHAREGWRLIVAVQEELRPCDPDEEDSQEENVEPIDLNTFYLEFIRPGRGTASVSAEVEDAQGETRLAELPQSIETNSHAR